MKVLILSCKTGGGHDAAGMALKEELESRGHQGIMLDYLVLAGQKVSNAVEDVYVNTVKKTPHVFGAVYNIGMAVSRITRKSAVPDCPKKDTNLPERQKSRQFLFRPSLFLPG